MWKTFLILVELKRDKIRKQERRKRMEELARVVEKERKQKEREKLGKSQKT